MKPSIIASFLLIFSFCTPRKQFINNTQYKDTVVVVNDTIKLCYFFHPESLYVSHTISIQDLKKERAIQLRAEMRSTRYKFNDGIGWFCAFILIGVIYLLTRKSKKYQ